MINQLMSHKGSNQKKKEKEKRASTEHVKSAYVT
jgi:hypothetical protein